MSDGLKRRCRVISIACRKCTKPSQRRRPPWDKLLVGCAPPARLSNAVEQVRDFATNQDLFFATLAYSCSLIVGLFVKDQAHLADIKEAPWLSVQRLSVQMCISILRNADTSVRAFVLFGLMGEVSHAHLHHRRPMAAKSRCWKARTEMVR